jgi:SAM-dependent methyltransferase
LFLEKAVNLKILIKMNFKLLKRITFRRNHFVDSIPKDKTILEIGPFYRPVCKGSNVKYFDIIDQKALIERAVSIDKNVNTANIPFINFVSPIGDLSVVNEQFDVIISCHAIEHQLDLIDHLQKTSKLLKEKGKYYVVCPDKRFCFDYFINKSSIADVINANQEKRTRHSLKNVIEHLGLTTHNNAKKHWFGIHGNIEKNSERIANAIKEYNKNEYIDVHAWYFTPNSFIKIINQLYQLGYIDFKISSMQRTPFLQHEFYAVLEKFES